jgi:hypothetical protein
LRVVLAVVAAIGLLLVFVTAFVAALLLHVDLPAARRAIARLASEQGSAGLKGSVEITDLSHVGPRAIDVGRITIRDPAGRPVAVVEGAHVRYAAVPLVRAFLSRTGRPPTIDRVVVERAKITLIPGEDGMPTLVEAVASKDPSPPSQQPSTLRLAIDGVDVQEIVADGTVNDLPIDVRAEIQGVAVGIAPEGTRVEVPHLGLASAPIPGIVGHGVSLEAAARAFLPGEGSATPMLVEGARVAIDAGSLKAIATGRMEGESWSARVEIPQLRPDALGVILGAPPPIAAPAAVAIDAAGDGRRALADLVARVGAGQAHLEARADLEALEARPTAERPRIELGEATLTTRGLDVRAAAEAAPAVSLDADLRLSAARTRAGDELSVVGSGTTTAGARPAPFEIDVVGTRAESGAIDASGRVATGLGGGKIDLRFDLDRTAEGGGHARAEVQGTVPDLASLRPLTGVELAGGLKVEATADVDLAATTGEIRARVEGHDLRHPSARVPRAVVEVAAAGSLAKPTFDATVTAPSIELGAPGAARKDVLSDVRLRAHGTPEAVGLDAGLRTDLGQRIGLRTNVAQARAGAVVTQTELRLEREDFVGEMKVDRVEVSSAGVRIDGLRLASTAGGLRAGGRFSPARGELEVQAHSTPLDLAALARAAGADPGELQGRLRLAVDLKTLPSAVRSSRLAEQEPPSIVLRADLDAPKAKAKSSGVRQPYVVGTVAFDLEDAILPQFGPVEAHVDVDVEDRLVEGTVDVRAEGIAEALVRGSAIVGGRLDDPRAWADAALRVDFEMPAIELAALGDRLRAMGNAVPTLAGTLDVRGHLERRSGDLPPTGAISIETKGLGYVDGATALQGVDVRARASLDGDRDAKGDDGPVDPSAPLFADLLVEAFDARGPFATIHAGTAAPWTKLGGLGDDPKAIPIDAAIVIAPTPIDRLPAPLAAAIPFGGRLGFQARATGTIADPTVEIGAKVDQIPLDGGPDHEVTFTAHYDGAIAKARAWIAKATAPDQSLFDLSAEAKVSAADVAAGRPDLPWTAKLDATIAALPLHLFAPVADADLEGHLSGEIHVDHVHDPKFAAPTVDATLVTSGLTVGRVALGEAKTELHADAQQAKVAVDVRGGEGGEMSLEARAPLTWKDALIPALGAGAVEAAFDARAFRLKTIEPFVAAVDKLDGKLDAEIRASVRRDAAGAWAGAPEGEIRVREGVVIVDAIGQRWQGLEADVAVTGGKLDLRRFAVAGPRGGELSASGNVVLEGLMPKTLHVALDARRFGIASQGVSVGELSGVVTVDGKMERRDDRDALTVDVTLDPLTIDLASEVGRDVQTLDADPSIAVLQPLDKDDVTVESGGGGMPMVVRVKMPNGLNVRRDDLRIRARGEPVLTIDEVVRYAGEVRIEGNPGSELVQPSWVEVLGKRFYIPKAIVRFDGDEKMDPALDIEARWQAADGTIVRILVSGRASRPKIDFRSPGLTQGEIMNLLVFGRREAGSAQQQQAAQRGAASQGAALASGIAGAVIGRQLQRVLPANFSISVGGGRYSGAVQYDNVFFEVAYNAGGTRIGPQALGQTQPRTTFGIDWRFAKSWSLLTTLGDTGSALVDLLWHYRY